MMYCMLYCIRGVTCPRALAGLRAAECDGGGQQRQPGLGPGLGSGPSSAPGQAGEVSHLPRSGSPGTVGDQAPATQRQGSLM